MSDCSWKGTAAEDLDRSYGKPQYPPLLPSSCHAILIRLPVRTNAIPEPFPRQTHDVWNRNYVRLPCSPQSLYPVSEDELQKRWEIIQEELQKSITSSTQLETAILSYNSRYASKWNFQSLHYFFCETVEEDEARIFFESIFPKLAQLACNLPQILTGGVPLLKQHSSASISLSQLQIASLLANAFFCTFPSRNTLKQTAEYSNYPDINFNRLFGCGRGDKEPSVQEKLKCIMNYFRRVVNDPPTGVVTFSRYYVVKEALPNWAEVQSKLPRLHISSEGTIEDEGQGMLQVDFANKFVGGGVLSMGCVQEEIRFVICPELIISRLFTECLDDTEALIITGCEQYNKYTGYADSFSWAGDHIDTTPVDEFGRRYCTVVAVDAIYYARNPSLQFSQFHLQRELNKAFVGFSFGPPICGIATGNWGCGVFCGNAELKALLQVMAAGQTGRDLAYFTFKDDKLRDSIYKMYKFLCDKRSTVGKLYKLLCRFSDHRAQNKNSDLYSFLYSEFNAPAQSKLSFSKPTSERRSEKFEPRKVQPPRQTTSSYFSANSSSATDSKSCGLSSDEIDNLLSSVDESTFNSTPLSQKGTSSQIIVDESTNGTCSPKLTESQVIEDSDQETDVNFKEIKTYVLSEEKDRKVCLEKHRNSWNHIDFGPKTEKGSPKNVDFSTADDRMEGCSVDSNQERSSLLALGAKDSDSIKKCSARIDKVQLKNSDSKQSASRSISKNVQDKAATGVKRKISDYFLPV
nr:PREDICTED: poly(ADP-ribose) glycohydrolase-like [Bemisia tabaci]